jgi:hypothetical protein
MNSENTENTENIDIIDLVENNPIEKINETKYQSVLIEKLKSNFINLEELLFLQNFYSYFKYDYQNDFVIDLDDVWKSFDFTKKCNLKYTLEKNFTIDKDYIINDTIQNNKKSGRGGHNKIFIMINIDTLKKLSLKSRTKKSNEFYENIDKLQKIINQTLQEIINDELNEKRINELRLQLEEKDTIITKKESEITMNSTINIVNLIENNPILTFNTTKYQSKLIEKLQSKFTNYEQQLFLSSFYCYLKYDKINDFIIDLDDVWKWLGFSKKYHAKYLLEKQFIIDKDYKILLPKLRQQDFMKKNDEDEDEDEIVPHPKKESKSSHGGNNKEIIMLNVKTFKKFCLKAGTKKADEIHDYFIKLEETLQEIINDESNELRLQLEEKDTIITEKDTIITKKDTIITKKESEIDKIKYEKMKEIEAVIISNFPLNTECVYLGRIDNRSSKNESLIKFGNTNNLGQRVLDHRKTYENFIVIHAFKVINKVKIETAIKTHPRISKQLRQININGNNKIEMIAYDVDSFTLDMLISLINNIIHDKTYSVKNFDRLVEENNVLKEENTTLKEENAKIDKIIEEHKKETHKHLLEINELREKLDNKIKIIDSINKDNESIYETAVIPEEGNHPKFDETPLSNEQQQSQEETIEQRFDEFIDKMCIVDPKLHEKSVNLECRFRIWNRRKPEKEVFHALKSYLETRFKPKRIDGSHSFCGLKLIELEYKKIRVNSSIETFIFENCRFSDTGKVFDSILLSEYQKWRKSINLAISDKDMVDMKSYLKENKNVLRAVIWTSNGSNNGYYGISLRKEESDTVSKKLTSSTAKKVEKVDCETGEVIGRWDSVAQTADFHGVCTAKISRYIKNGTVVSNYYFKSC